MSKVLLNNFPLLSADKISDEAVLLPLDFQGEINFVVLGFYDWQKGVMDSWMSIAQRLEKRYDQLKAYQCYVFALELSEHCDKIQEALKDSIKEEEMREKSFSVYVDKGSFLERLGLDGDDIVHVLLLDQDGRIVAATHGKCSDDIIDSLTAKIHQELVIERL